MPRPTGSRCKMGGKLGPFLYRIHMEDCRTKLFIGLDVSLEKTAICVISEHGKIVKEAQGARCVVALDQQDSAIAAVGLEAGPMSPWLYRGCQMRGSLSF